MLLHAQKKRALLSGQGPFLRTIGLMFTVMTVSACSTLPDLWQGEEVLVEVKQEELEQEFDTFSDDYKVLNEKFLALERLYIELAAQVQAQGELLRQAQSNGSVGGADLSALQSSIDASSEELSSLARTVEGLENRLYSVELEAAADKSDAVPAQVTPTDADVDGDTESDGGGEPVEPVEAIGSVAAADVISGDLPGVTLNQYGVHLASYRSQEQISGAWGNLVSVFSELEGTSPLVFSQTQDGIGDFLRLIAGPYETEQQAEAACDRIKQVSADQYCRVSSYEGEALGG